MGRRPRGERSDSAPGEKDPRGGAKDEVLHREAEPGGRGGGDDDEQDNDDDEAAEDVRE